ncbi:MerR family DNA-binding protein [Mycobacterium intracellulare]|uniref:MerR family DNA-binding protein n=1 Tax=Mycobacterium intracellulare TaxID=1767 RepID=UPI001CD91832|nr:MerR family DNA-binding protein [Mycobacterium intracellulare]MCA2306388.1 MerR family DNA-binding protein [Mycobacterium intracellulare]MCA2348736.1 MerR family DNA-binding protein [Mycobacterium intracellulare]
MESAMFTAGRAAARAGITRKALRLYEAKGLVDEPVRTAAGYRLYSPDDIAVLTFIRRARTLGLHLDDIAAILGVRRAGASPCQRVRTFIDSRITEIDTAIADLRVLRRTLVETRDTPTPQRAAPTSPARVCPILEGFPAC